MTNGDDESEAMPRGIEASTAGETGPIPTQPMKEHAMVPYSHSRPHPVFAVAAALASALVLGLAVVGPVAFAPDPDVRNLARLAVPVEVAIEPSRIDVIGVRSQLAAENSLYLPASSPSTPKS